MRFYVPALATDMKDLEKRVDILKPLLEYGTIALEYITPNPKFLEESEVKIQLENIKKLLKKYEINHVEIHDPFVLHNPIRPLDETNFLYEPEKATALVLKSIDYATRLPEPISYCKVNIHLNTLVKPEEWKDSLQYWEGAFDFLIKPKLLDVVEYGKEKGVDVLIETMPIREFGDSHDPELYELLEPYPILPNREIPEIRKLGGKITFDICHCDVTARAIRYCHRLGKMGIENPHLYYGFFKEDLEALPKNFHLFHYLEDLERGDHLHLSGSKGLFIHPNLAKKLGLNPSFHIEGIELGKGGMTKNRVSKIIKMAEDKDVGVTLEIADDDPKNPIQTERSVKFIRELYETGYL